MIALAAAGAEDGVWLRAERQTAGRGRQSRVWQSPAGNLYASTLVRLRPADPTPATLALVAAVALEEAVSAYFGAGQVQLKWPNDLLLSGAKLSGILLERSGDAIVIGFGVNLAHHPTDVDRVTTSLAAHGVATNPDDFIVTLAECFARWLARWRGEGLAPIRDRWTACAHPAGTALTARLPDGSAIDGIFDRLNGDGALILRLADGTQRVIHAGDVFLI
ncbi:biotin--[acetyl-CoA-carboxylase] ligase [Sphingomonas sp. 28-63-12]|uniref:biotin--[acetyl-CoA-carboxylase] ligase n=1 Tax=Sphingomonas sp. 28-63-12 TaxID=1970434 RepID=UPI0035A8F398